MSRYLERVEHTARLLDLTLNQALDQSPDVARQRWQLTLASLRSPEPETLEAYPVTQFLTFDTKNKDSLVSCIMAARENARQIREQISSEMWEQLNHLYLSVRSADINSIYAQPHGFYGPIKSGAHLFQGITDSTLMRNEGWHFIQLGRYIERAGATVHLLGGKSRRSALSMPLELARVVRAVRPDLIQGWMYHGNLAATLIAPGLGTPPVLWNIRQSLEDLDGDKFLTRQVIRLGRALSARPQRIIYNSHAAARQHHAFGYHDGAVEIIANGFETDRTGPDQAVRAAQRAALAIPSDAPLFLHVARFHPMKDHRSFVAAAVRCLETLPQARFVLAGSGVSAASVGLAELLPTGQLPHFVFPGEVGEIMGLMQAADVLVVSSCRSEGFPNVLGEAMLAGTPCIATDVGDCALILEDAGLVVPARDPEGLALAMVRLGRDAGLRLALGERVCDRFAIEGAVSRYLALYQTMLNEAGHR